MAGRKASAARRKPPTKASGTVEVPEAAPRGALPDFIPPELATLVDKAPDGDKWLHEIKFDGYRTAAHLRSGRVRMLTRKGPRLDSPLSADRQSPGGAAGAQRLCGRRSRGSRERWRYELR